MLDKFLYDNFPLFDKKKLVVGVSGGIDSMVLLDLLLKSNVDFVVCHIDHHTRNGTSSHDALFVKRYSMIHNIPFYKKEYHHIKGNFQSLSREFRYNFFKKIKHELSADLILTAHHMDDSIETFIHNAMRGSGIKGLRGIPYSRDSTIRPLINFTKQEIEDYAFENNIPFTEDDTNSLNDYSRNKIRNNILPSLAEVFPQLYKGIGTTLKTIDKDYSLLQALISEKADSIFESKGNEIFIDIEKLLTFNENITLLYHILSPMGFSLQQVHDCIDSKTGSMFHSKTHSANKNRGQLIITPKNLDILSTISIPGPGIFPLNRSYSISIEIRDRDFIAKQQEEIILDAKRIHFPILIRPWESGDRFQPAGMKGKSKKVSKILKDLKIPLINKTKIIVLISDGNICCIPGIRADERYAINDHTEKVVVISKININ